VQAILTPAGATVFHRAQPIFTDAVARQLGGPLNATEVTELHRLLNKLLGAESAESAADIA
jgi:hypothetical protein